MRESVGKIIFFEAIAEGLLQFNIGPTPNRIALLFKDSDSMLLEEDQVDLAESLCRISGNTAAHVHVRYYHDNTGVGADEPVVIKACGLPTSEAINLFPNASAVVMVDFSENDSDTFVVTSFDLDADKDLVVSALHKLFAAAKLQYDSLSFIRFRSHGFKVLKNTFDLFDSPVAPDLLDPSTLERFCEAVSQSWFYEGHRVFGSSVYQWVLQFKKDGFIREACELLLYLKREGFITQSKIAADLKRLYDTHLETVKSVPVVMTIQPTGKSEKYLSYNLAGRVKFTSMEDTLKQIASSKHEVEIICIDDVSVSGKTILDYLFEPNKQPLALNFIEAIRKINLKVTALVSIADERAIDAIENDPRACGLVKVKAARTMGNRHRVFHSESNFFSVGSKTEQFKSFCLATGKKIYKDNPLGWNSAEWCIVLDYTVPNGTLPIFFASREGVWKSLFPRKRTPTRPAASK